MNAAGFALGLGLIAIAVIVAMFFAICWGELEDDEPTEHGDFEP